MPASLLMEVFDNLQRTLSMSVPFVSENLVGRVILGGKTCVIIASTYSLVLGLCSTFSRSMLKSPTITTSPFVFEVETTIEYILY